MEETYVNFYENGNDVESLSSNKRFFFPSIQARIDSHNKILYARHANQRNATFQRAMQAGADYQRDTRALILRASLLRNDATSTKTRGKGAWKREFDRTNRIMLRMVIW